MTSDTIEAKLGLIGIHGAVLTAFDEQSPDIAMRVDPGGAGDQGIILFCLQ